MADSKATNFGHQIRRAITVVFIVGGALVGGTYLALGLLEPTISASHLALAAAGLGVSTLATILKDSSRLLPSVRSYIVEGGGEGIYPLAALAAALGLTATGFAWALAGIGEPRDPAPPEGPPDLVYVENPSRVTYVLPFFEEASVCAADGSCPDGVELDEAMSDFLEGLATSLVHCGSDERPVELRVSGFASSSEFRDRLDSDSLNLDVAHRRAKEVAQAMKKVAGDSRLKVVLRLWDDHGTMVRHAGFKDTSRSDVYSEHRGILNRRVEITLVDPSDCRPWNLRLERSSPPGRDAAGDLADIDLGGPGDLESSSAAEG